MPIPGTHVARQKSPGACDKIRTQADAMGKGVTVLWCVRAGKPTEPESIHFDAKQFTADEAKAWLAKHQFKADRFEPAAPEPKAGADVDVAAETYPSEVRCGYGGGDAVEIEAQAAGSADLPRVSMLGYTGVPMKLDGFHLPVIVDLETLKVPRQKVPILRGHDADRIAGHSDKIDLSPQRLKATGVLSGMPEHTADLTHTARHGFPWQVSIGAQTTTRPQHVPAGETVKVNGRNWSGPLLVARGAVLRELSLLPMGADGNTDAGFSAGATTDAAAAAGTEGA
jgi:hypothetical protein